MPHGFAVLLVHHARYPAIGGPLDGVDAAARPHFGAVVNGQRNVGHVHAGLGARGAAGLTKSPVRAGLAPTHAGLVVARREGRVGRRRGLNSGFFAARCMSWAAPLSGSGASG